jgi:hypothetical protein
MQKLVTIRHIFKGEKIRLRKLCIFAGEGTRKRRNAFTKCNAKQFTKQNAWGM